MHAAVELVDPTERLATQLLAGLAGHGRRHQLARGVQDPVDRCTQSKVLRVIPPFDGLAQQLVPLVQSVGDLVGDRGAQLGVIVLARLDDGRGDAWWGALRSGGGCLRRATAWAWAFGLTSLVLRCLASLSCT